MKEILKRRSDLIATLVFVLAIVAMVFLLRKETAQPVVEVTGDGLYNPGTYSSED